MKAFTSIILALFLSVIAFAQQTANYVANWHFGQQSAVNFTNGTPVNEVSEITGNEAITTMSDGDGNILFYSSSDSVWDATNRIMPGSYGLMGTFTASCGLVSCRVPGACDQYYLFYISNSVNGYTIRYSVIDMNLPGNGTLTNPLGDVVSGQKDLMLYNGDKLAEKLLIIQKGNTENYWLMARSTVNDVYYAFEVGANGIVVNPVVSTLSNTVFPNQIGSPVVGWLAVNRHRNMIAEANGLIPDLKVYNFDNRTGIVSNSEVLMPNLIFPLDITYGVAFSASGNKLYVGWNDSLNSNYISAFDVSGGIGTIEATRVDHDITGEFLQSGMCRAMLLGPDDKIYIAWDGIANNPFLGVINEPENMNNPNITMRGHMVTNISKLGLPNIAYYYHPRNFVDSIAGDCIACSGDTVMIGRTDYDSIWGTYSWEPANFVMNPSSQSTLVTLDSSRVFSLNIYDPCGDFIKGDTISVTVDPCITNVADIEKEQTTLMVFPNPTTNQVIIDGFRQETPADIYVLNSIGQTVRSWFGMDVSMGSVQIHLDDLPKSTYFISVHQFENPLRYLTVIKK